MEAGLLTREYLCGILLRSLKAQCVVAIVMQHATTAELQMRVPGTATTFVARKIHCEMRNRDLELCWTPYVVHVPCCSNTASHVGVRCAVCDVQEHQRTGVAARFPRALDAVRHHC
jgi:hypothetical protein